MKTEIRKVEPHLASTWLVQSKDNRPLRRSHVSYLAKEMKEGRWRLTHQGIAFGPNGDLMDGQHRLQAIKEAGVPVVLQVSYYDQGDNINFAFPILDRGLTRSVADITRIDSKLIQIYNVLLWMGVKKSRIPPDDYLIFDSKIGHTARMFLAACPYQRTYYTPAIVRAAAVVMLHLNKSPLSHISLLFTAWGTGNINNTPPIVNAFMNYIPGLKLQGTRVNDQKFYAAAVYALEQNNSDKSKIHIIQSYQDQSVKDCKDMVDKLMQRRNMPKADLLAIKDGEIKKWQDKYLKQTSSDINAEQIKLSKEAQD